MLLAAVLVVPACAGLRREQTPTDVALYRARVSLREGDSRAFPLLLFAAPPDRLHAEVLGPMGSPHLVVDAGSGRIAVAFPGEGVAYVGDAEPEALSRVLGVPVSLESFVRFLTEGADPAVAGLVLTREPPGAGLPSRAQLSSGAASLTLRRREWRPSPPDPGALGAGIAAPGLDIRPLTALPDLGFPAIGASL